MVIDLTGVDNIVNDFVGNISGIKIFALSNIHLVSEKIFSLIKQDNYVEILIETLPSEIILRQIFNEKIKIGKLIIDIQPNIVIVNSEIIKILKDWDLLLHHEPIARDYGVIAYLNEENLSRLCYPNPEYDILGRLVERELDDEVKQNAIKTTLNHREAPRLLREGKASSAILYKTEAENLGLKYKVLNVNITINLGLFKNSDKLTINIYENLRNKIRKLLKEVNMDILT